MGDQENLCTYENIHNYRQFDVSSKCAFVQKYCGEQTSLIDNISIYYCFFGSNIIYFILYSIPYLLFCFYWLSSTAEEYLEPAVSKLSKFLNLSESLAGITLIALANGAPDVIACFVANEGKDDKGITLSMGALFGASIFATTIILGRVVLNSDRIKLDKKALTRDIGFFLIADAYLLIMGYLGEISLIYGIGFVFIYVIFVCYAIWEEVALNQQELEKEIQLSKIPSLDAVPAEVDFNLFDVEDLKNRIAEGQVKTEIIQSLAHLELNDNRRRKPRKHSTIVGRHDIKLLLTKLKTVTQKETLTQVINVIEKPFMFIRDVTVPYLDYSKYNKLRVACYPFLTTLFIFWRIDLLDIWYNVPMFWAIFVPATILPGLVIYKLLDIRAFRDNLQVPFIFLNFVASILWIHFVAEMLMDYLAIVQIISDLPPNFIGLTILAWGNSSNDFFVDVALAKKGLGIMAMSGIFAGQFFNLTVGFGLVLIKKTISGTPITFNLFDGEYMNNINLLMVVFSILSLLMTLINSYVNRFDVHYKYGYYLAAFYVIFFGVISFATF